jgi:hypothetical protein
MTHRTIHIRGWRVDVFIEDGYHPDMVMECLEEMDAPNDILEKAHGLIVENKPNQAFTYSNGRRTCIYIGWTTSGEEFLNSLVHEIRHLVDHIAAFYGLENNEAVGYLSGDAALLLAEDICEHGCVHCRKEYV